MDYKKFFRDYFEYYPSEKKGVFILSLIIALWIGGLYVYTRMPVDYEDDEEFEKAVAAYYHAQEVESKTASVDDRDPVEEERNWNLFSFDPNTLSRDSMVLLGLSERVASTIVNYRKSGGQFRSPADLARIYSINESDFKKVERYIDIPQQPDESQEWKEEYASDYESYDENESESESSDYDHDLILELNAADTTQLKKIFGIGPYFAREIVNHREALGGYLRMDQLLEIYNLDTAALDKIAPRFTLDPSMVKRIDLNQITLDQLRVHPYVPYSIANSIIRMREAHGPYQKIEDIRRSHLINDSVFERIKPYLIVHE